MKLWTVLAVLAGLATTAMSQTIPQLTVRGTRMVDPKGNAVTLRGCNLGNWLMIELWMLGIEGDCGAKDQQDLFNVLDGRFGRPEREHLFDLYRANWITERDFDIIKSYRFNLVRLPMDYRLFEDDAKPKVLRPDAFKWVDWCVKEAGKRGIYVLLDMHGIQGGQSPYEHTGMSDQNKFWTSPEDQARGAWLWEQIAKRYRNNPAVVAYDLMNEPYGGTHESQAKAFPMLLEAVRKADPEKLVFFHGHYDGFEYYGDPKEKGWHNVGFQMHYYPGLFGNGRPSIQTHMRHFESLKPVAEKVEKLQVPFIVGEMNPVFAKLGTDLLRRTYDIHESYGWMTTVWSYKVGSSEGGFKGGSWGLVSNADPMPRINFRNDSLEKIQSWIRNLGTMKWDVYQALHDTMAPIDAHLKPLPPMEEALKPRTSIPAEETLQGWTATDIGGAKTGSLKLNDGGAFNLYGSGDDIWNSHDAARFLYRQVTGDFDISVTVDGMDELEMYAKAGLWVKSDLSANGTHALLSTFSDGGLQLVQRKEAGGNTSEFGSADSSLPGVTLRLVRKGTKIEGYFHNADSTEWRKLGESDRPDLPAQVYVGVLSLSHDANSYNEVRYRNLTLK